MLSGEQGRRLKGLIDPAQQVAVDEQLLAQQGREIGQAPVPRFLYGSVIEEARKQNVKVAAHVYYLEDAKELVRRGAAMLAHSVQDREVDDKFLKLAKQEGVTQVTTLAGIGRMAHYANDAPLLDDPGLAVLFPRSVLATSGVLHIARAWRTAQSACHPQAVRNGCEEREENRHSRHPHRPRNRLRLGGKVPWPVGTLGDGAVSQRWPDSLEVIRAATINGAKFLGLEKHYGSIGPGQSKVADFIVLNADPAG